MADLETVADGTVTAQDTEPTQTDETPEIVTEAAAPVDDATEDEGEPGGSGPEETRARKEYRARKRIEQQLESERIERVRLEERLKTLEEVSKAPAAQPQRIFTPQEVQAAVDAGQVSAAEGMAYLARVEAQRALEAEREKAAAQKPFERATTEVNEYMVHLPWTRDRSSPEFARVAAEYQSLVQNYGFADDIRTQRIALERVAGPLDKLKQRAQVASTTRQVRAATASHSESPAGGSAPRKSDDISSAPDHIKRVWDQTGLTAAQRAKEWEYYRQSQPRKAG